MSARKTGEDELRKTQLDVVKFKDAPGSHLMPDHGALLRWKGQLVANLNSQ